MIKEAYCSFEISKLLKDKGFDEPCLSYFWTEDNGANIDYCDRPFTNKQLYSGQILRPTHQMAMSWLREVHGIYIVFFHTNKSGWWYNITDMIDSYVFYSSEKIMCSYEEVVDLAIKYTLKNLI